MTIPLMTELRNATQAIHEKIHGLDYFKSINDSSLSSAQYANHLHALAIVWCSLEHQIAAGDHKNLTALAGCMTSKWPALEHDLKNLGNQSINGAVLARALDIVSDLLFRSAENPNAIIGHAYVMQGSMNGAYALRKNVIAALGNDKSVRYLDAGGAEFKQQWSAFAQMADALVLSADDRYAIVAAAQEIFAGLHELFSEIGRHKPGETQSVHITAVNPEAGNHAMPQNPTIIAAAIRAGVKAWAEYPYLKLRYGERGKRFAKSDSCWLATLADLPQKDADAQVAWLARLLAARGMPSIILVRHLNFLVETLAEIMPENVVTYQILSKAASKLFSGMTRGTSHTTFEQDALKLHGELVGIADFPKNSGEVLLSSVLDAKAGLSANGESASDWLQKSFCYEEQKYRKFKKIWKIISS